MQQDEELMYIIDENVLIMEVNKDNIITKVSDALCNVSGYTQEELIGQKFEVLRHHDTPYELLDKIWEVISSGDSYKGDLKLKKKDGGFFWIHTTITPKFSSENEIIGYYSIGYDITDKKLLEEEIKRQKKEVEHMHRQTKDSIEFASFLQSAITPTKGIMNKYFSDHFVIWYPKDIVGGDIWLFDELRHDDECLLMCIDCTGHGVPGAFVTMIVKSIEREIVSKINENEDMVVSPAWILSYFNRVIKELLKQDNKKEDISLANAGFDGGVIYYNKQEKVIKYAGAGMPLFYSEDNKIKMIKGDRYSVGYKKCSIDYQYTDYVIPATKGKRFYITTDGYIDQNGGDKGFPFGKKRFMKLLEETLSEPMAEQQTALLFEMMEYQFDEDRNDDITVIGFEI